MALPGTGYRTVYSMALEMGFHLLEPYCVTTMLTAVAAAGAQTVTIGTMGFPVGAIYNGAQLVIDPGTSQQEIVVVSAFNNATNQFTAVFNLTHAIGAVVIGATFPSQAISGDQYFNQNEICTYLGKAQHEFLSRVPSIIQFNTQTVKFGQIYQNLACNAIEMMRVASSTLDLPLLSLVRVGNVVTATIQGPGPHGVVPSQKFSIANSPDPSFNGGFKVATVPSPTTWTYAQYAPNATVNGGDALLWTRLYETSQEELMIQDPGWRNRDITQLRSWYQDRTGLYQFGVDGKPGSNFPIEVMIAARDSSTLPLTDGFLVPDLFLHFVKYKALEYCWSKDGEQRNPQMAEYSRMRFERGVTVARRWLDWAGMEMKTLGIDTAQSASRA